MAKLRSIRFRRRKHRIKRSFDLQLTSMMDVLVIILVFLLRSYSVSTNNFSTIPGMKLPMSRSQDLPPDSLQLIITPESMTFENERIMDFVITPDSMGSTEPNYMVKKEDLAESGRQIIPLYDALMKTRERSELLRAKSKARDEKGNPLPFDGVLAIQADKRIHYDILRRVMYTAGTAGYKVFRLLAMRREN